MSGGLFSSLALSTTLAASLLGGGDIPNAPELSDQSQTETQKVQKTDNGSERKEKRIITGRSAASTEQIENFDIAGIDISSHQSGIKLDETLATDAVDFGFVKATQGTGYINPNFRDDYISFLDSGKPVGSYHYAQPTSSTEDARKQARVFLAVTGIHNGVKMMDPVLDIEESNGVSPDDLIEWTKAFVDEIKKQSGRDTIIYTYYYFWKDSMKNTTEFNDLPLWFADYGDKSEPDRLPGQWDDWTFWQYTSEGRVDGYDGNIDLNVFNGTESELKKMFYSKKHKSNSSKDNTEKTKTKSRNKTSYPSLTAPKIEMKETTKTVTKTKVKTKTVVSDKD